MQSFRNLEDWTKAHALTLHIYRASQTFPLEERFGLTSQMRRSSASIGANIAEGCCRSGDAEFGRFLQIALGSASELEYHLLLASDLNLLPRGGYQTLASEVTDVKRMLASLIRRLKTGSGRLRAEG